MVYRAACLLYIRATWEFMVLSIGFLFGKNVCVVRKVCFGNEW